MHITLTDLTSVLSLICEVITAIVLVLSFLLDLFKRKK